MKKSAYLFSGLILTFSLASCGTPSVSSSVSSGNGSSAGPATSIAGTSYTSVDGTTSQSNASEGSGSAVSSESTAPSVSSDGTSSSASSSSAGTSLPSIDYVKVFCETSWSYTYAWITNNGSVTKLCGDWPGAPLNSYNDKWKTYDFKGYASLNIIFNKGSGGQQTKDLSIASAGYWWYYNNQWYQSEPSVNPPSFEPNGTTSGTSMRPRKPANTLPTTPANAKSL
jgi:hypothetical protein